MHSATSWAVAGADVADADVAGAGARRSWSYDVDFMVAIVNNFAYAFNILMMMMTTTTTIMTIMMRVKPDSGSSGLTCLHCTRMLVGRAHMPHIDAHKIYVLNYINWVGSRINVPPIVFGHSSLNVFYANSANPNSILYTCAFISESVSVCVVEGCNFEKEKTACACQRQQTDSSI
jgi:hypothetical protein